MKKNKITSVDEITKTVGAPFVDNAKMSMRDVDVFYGDKQAIMGVSLDIGVMK